MKHRYEMTFLPHGTISQINGSIRRKQRRMRKKGRRDACWEVSGGSGPVSDSAFLVFAALNE